MVYSFLSHLSLHHPYWLIVVMAASVVVAMALLGLLFQLFLYCVQALVFWATYSIAFTLFSLKRLFFKTVKAVFFFLKRRVRFSWRRGGAHRDEGPREEALSPRNGFSKLLGVPEGATRAVIRAAYKEKMKLFHPDKYQNLPPEVLSLLEKECVQVKEAYEALSR